MKRSLAREAGFLIIFEYSFGFSSIDEIIALAKECREFECDSYSTELAKGVTQNLEQIDALIVPNLRGYVIERISKITLAALRCAIWEFYVSKQVAVEISINEAVELTKKYGTPEDASFVNGVLGSIARCCEQSQTPPAENTENSENAK